MEFGKTSDFTFKQLKIEDTFGIGIARNEIPDFDEKVKKLPNVLFGSLAKKLVKETFKKSSPFYNSLGSEVAVADGVWYGACVSPKDSDDEVISTAHQIGRTGSFDSVVNANLKDRQMALLQRANEHLTADLSY